MIVALDVGDKRIGVAKCVLGMVFPVETVFRKTLQEDLEYIKKLFVSIGADKIVCGLPVNFDGTPSIQTEKTEKFIQRLEAYLNVEIERVDERCTTSEARELLIESNYSPKKRKSVIDQVAAVYILEDYLSRRKGG